MKVAVEGCCHGELDAIYKSIESEEVDLLIIGGDFQAVRNQADLQCMAVPNKFKRLGDFHAYYSGVKTAPVLTLFIGGNHEASNYMQELPYGGWIARNIFYLGLANVIQFGGLRIGGISGIWGGRDYVRGYFEKPPYDKSTLRSVYHVRQFQVKKLLQVKDRLDAFMSHDWPRGVEQHGDVKALIRVKPFFKDEINSNDLGSPAAEELMKHLKPKYWFSAHLHVKFEAMVSHVNENKRKHEETEIANPDELELSLSDDEPELTLEEYKTQVLKKHDLADIDEMINKTQFLALDKCLPRREFLKILNIPCEGDKQLRYDPEWLAITKAFTPFTSITGYQKKLPDMTTLVDEHREWAEQLNLLIPENFERTAPGHEHTITERTKLEIYRNPQTVQYCKLLQIDDPFHLPLPSPSASIRI